MTEQTTAAEIVYAEEYIGECTSGRCDLPATVQVYEDFMLCALHHMRHELGQEEDEASIALGLIKGWHSIANMHGNLYLIRMFNRAETELIDRMAAAERRAEQLERIGYEAEHGQALRVQGGVAGPSEQERAGALPELSAFGRQIVAITGYLGEDLTRLARDMVHTAGCEDGTGLVAAFEARMRSADAEPLGPEFMEKLAAGLGLGEPERKGLAMAYALERFVPPEDERRTVLSIVNGHLTEAAELLEESHAPTEEQGEEERQAARAIAEAGGIIARLQRGAGSGKEASASVS